MNQFAHLRAFPDHTFKEVVRPNADTLYSIAWFDVSREPQVLSVSDTGGRYYMLQILDMWTDLTSRLLGPGGKVTSPMALNRFDLQPTLAGSSVALRPTAQRTMKTSMEFRTDTS